MFRDIPEDRECSVLAHELVIGARTAVDQANALRKGRCLTGKAAEERAHEEVAPVLVGALVPLVSLYPHRSCFAKDAEVARPLLEILAIFRREHAAGPGNARPIVILLCIGGEVDPRAD